MTNFPDLDAYLEYLRIERGAADNTIAAYSTDLRRLHAFLGQRSPASAEREDIRNFLASLHDSGLTGNGIARRFAAIKGFYRFLRYSGKIRADPTRGIRPPKLHLSLIQNVPDPDVSELIAYLASQPESPTVLRDRAMIQTFYDSGLRVGELIGLRIAGVDFAGMALRVTGKGNKQRLAPISPPQAIALRAYLERGRPVLMGKRREHGILFVSGEWGWGSLKRSGGSALTRQTPFNIVQTLGIAVLGRSIHPHQLRHSFGSTLIAHGADPRNVQALMGHADIDTTMRYVHVEMNTLKEVHSKTHPRG